MLSGKKIGFIGAGQMCEAIMAGALSAGALRPENVFITDVDHERLDAMAADYGVNAVQNNADGSGIATVAACCNIVLLCVKPQILHSVLSPAIAAFKPETLVVSIIGGTTLATLENLLPNSPIIRVMPNTTMLVRKGVAALSPGHTATHDDIALCNHLFSAVGECYEVAEKSINPITSISGCGPAYVFMFIEALADAAVEQGLPRQMALSMAAQTVAGSAEMVLQTNRHPGKLKDEVCSPGGGTIAGVHALEAGAFRGTVMNAVDKARSRMDQLGKESK